MFTTFKKIVVYSLLAYTILGFFLLPILVKSQIIQNFHKQSSAELSIENLSFNPYIFRLELSGVALYSQEKELLFSLDSFVVNLDPSYLFSGTIYVKELLLKAPEVNLVYTKERKINLLEIFPKEKDSPSQSTEEKGVLPHIVLAKVSLEEGALFYEDYTRKTPFEFSVEKIGFTLKDIDTYDINSTKGSMRFYSTLGDGGFVDLRSKIIGFEPFALQGSLDFEASKLYTEWKYVRDDLQLEVADGKISFHSEYYFNSEAIDETEIKSIEIDLSKLRIKPKMKHHDILTLAHLSIENGLVKPMKQWGHVDKIALNGLDVEVKREADGTIDWLEYIQSEKSSVEENTTKRDVKTQAWDFRVENIALEEMAFRVEDLAIKPAVTTELNRVDIYAKGVTLKGEEPFTYKMNILLNSESSCSLEGDVRIKELLVNSLSSCKNLNVVHYKPYIDTMAKEQLTLYNIDLKKAYIDFNISSKLFEDGENFEYSLEKSYFALKEAKVHKKSTQESLVSFEEFSLAGITLDSKTKELTIEKGTLLKPFIALKRYKNGQLNVEKLVVPKASKVVKKKSTTTDEKSFHVRLKEFGLQRGKLLFRDNNLSKRTSNSIRNLSVKLSNIDSQEKKWLSYRVFMNVTGKGVVQAQGKLQHTPLLQRGKFSIQNIALKKFSPYVEERAYVKIEDGELTLKGKTEFTPESKAADFHLESSFELSNFFVKHAKSKELLLSLSNVKSDQVTFELAPNRLYINELDIDSFYVNAKIDANKSMNFAQLLKETNSTKETQEHNSSESEPFPFNILKVQVSSGSAKFTDYSIPIKFSTHIHNVDGYIYAISNRVDATSYVNITGEVDKYGSTRLKGSVDSAQPKKYTDLTFNFKNIDLSSLSGYSASFAGHEIDSGKLYLDLGYKVLNSELKGSNNIIMKKVVLGKEVEDENVTVLPLGFVLGLLEDSDGIVDIDMPVEGNLDEPDFKYGALVLKTIGNLIAKAVLSPFKFLGSVMGIDTSDLEYLDFEAGKALITPPEREKLDKIAKMMQKKPKITLALTGHFNNSSDKEALALEKLIRFMLQRSEEKNEKDRESLINIELLESSYAALSTQEKLDALKERIEASSSEEAFSSKYKEALLSECLVLQGISHIELEELADKRVEAIKNYLVQEKFLDAHRVVQKESVEDTEDEKNIVKVKMEIEVE